MQSCFCCWRAVLGYGALMLSLWYTVTHVYFLLLLLFWRALLGYGTLSLWYTITHV
jgi:hypothetical protein